MAAFHSSKYLLTICVSYKPIVGWVGRLLFDYLGKPSLKKNGETWEKDQTSFTPSLPPSTWEPLTVTFLLHIWALGTLRKILRATYFFPSQKWSDTQIILLYCTLRFNIRTQIILSVRPTPLKCKNILCVYFVFQIILSIF